MRAGAFEYRIEIYRHAVTQSYSGFQDEVWQLLTTTRANVVQTSGNRVDENNAIFYDYSKTFTVHKYVNVDEFDLVKFKGKYYRILSIDEDRHLNQKVLMTELVEDQNISYSYING